MKRRSNLADILSVIIALSIAASLAWRIDWPTFRTAEAVASAALPKETMSLADAASKGNSEARVVLIEYSDFECPFCKLFASTILPTLDREYVATGKARFVYRHTPLAEIHPQAVPAARAAECARRAGKFWEMHDLLFAEGSLYESFYSKAAAQLGLPSAAFEACMVREGAGAVDSDISMAKKLEIVGTPTFFIGLATDGGDVRVISMMRGAQSIETFREVLNSALANES